MCRARRAFIAILLLMGVFAGLAGCEPGRAHFSSTSSETNLIDRALIKGGRFLLARQEADGAWRSDHYGGLKDGASLTPLVLQALRTLPPSPARDEAYRRG